MKKIISASRRTDLPAFFPEWLAAALRAGRAEFIGPSGRGTSVSLVPAEVHSIVLWSKDFSGLLAGRHGLRELLGRYDQLCFLFTITGLGGTFIEPGVLPPHEALSQLPGLVRLAGDARRVSIRFDPVIFWREGEQLQSNLDFFDRVAREAAAFGIRDMRFSFAQWYRKAVRRALARGFDFVDPPVEEKRAAAERLAERAGALGLNLYACSQDILAGVRGVKPSACIDGARLQGLHPRGEPASRAKDSTQRPECRCTRSVDIGSYTRVCPHACLYCYANPG
ncbi:MAG: hypothetical protein A2Y86_04810 [Candidatus Aminicenantes bacterium RBG_13_62_12]|nr:MAG: hypothetical protein A2Y86_04810 [Candidatus Aminicenantes bacterium RBG_13_62_12]